MGVKSGTLHTLLFEEGRELVNIKFFPGTDRGLTRDRVKEAAHAALQSAFEHGLEHVPPTSGRTAISLREFIETR